MAVARNPNRLLLVPKLPFGHAIIGETLFRERRYNGKQSFPYNAFPSRLSGMGTRGLNLLADLLALNINKIRNPRVAAEDAGTVLDVIDDIGNLSR